MADLARVVEDEVLLDGGHINDTARRQQAGVGLVREEALQASSKYVCMHAYIHTRGIEHCCQRNVP